MPFQKQAQLSNLDLATIFRLPVYLHSLPDPLKSIQNNENKV